MGHFLININPSFRSVDMVELDQQWNGFVRGEADSKHGVEAKQMKSGSYFGLKISCPEGKTAYPRVHL